MKSTIYIICLCALAALKSLAAPQTVIITIPEAEKPEEKDKDAPPAEEPIKLPEDIRTQLNVNVINESGHFLGFYTKIRAATEQEGGVIQGWEYLKVLTLVKESVTVATFHGGPGAKYEYERSRVQLYDKDSNEWANFVECKLAPSVAGKTAAKSITFVVGKEPGEDVTSCLIYYDKQS